MMQLQLLSNSVNGQEEQSQVAPSSFIRANTLEMPLDEIKHKHIIPVFAKDNEPAIAHTDFIEVVVDAAGQVFPSEAVLKPTVRVSHPIKGRVPEARNKPAKELMMHEKTLYYERMMFMVKTNNIIGEVGGNTLSLTLGGVKSYGEDNLGSKKGSLEHFHLFIGFRNLVCTNLCVSTDGLKGNLTVQSLDELYTEAIRLFNSFEMDRQLQQLNSWMNYSLSEAQFAHLLGRCRIYQFMPQKARKGLPELLFTDSQVSQVAKLYTQRENQGEIPLWDLYNLFTDANKSSYIDKFLVRGVNAGELVSEVAQAMENGTSCWYLN